MAGQGRVKATGNTLASGQHTAIGSSAHPEGGAHPGGSAIMPLTGSVGRRKDTAASQLAIAQAGGSPRTQSRVEVWIEVP